MDALTVLRREHTRIEQLFVELDTLRDCACSGRAALMREIDRLVRRHLDMEDALHPRGSQERHLILDLLGRISQTDCRSDAYVPRVRELRNVLLRHIEAAAQVA